MENSDQTAGNRVSARPDEPAHSVDGATLEQALGASVAWLERHIDPINSLNVFPVPDGDTGTNMYLTMQAALKETVGLAETTVGSVIGAVAHGALMGARGNSGVILSQILRGMAQVLGKAKELDGEGLAKSLREGAITAYKGVITPVEGTILTVIRESADAAKLAFETEPSLLSVLEKTVEEAAASVKRTPTLLVDLREAGVVDAGGQGLYTILEGVLRYLRGEEMEHVAFDGTFGAAVMESGGEYGYEALFLLRGAELPVDQIRSSIMSMGESVLVVGDERMLKIHVHTGRPGAILDYAIGLGNISDVVIENLQQQTDDFTMARREQPPQEVMDIPAESLADVAIVAVASGAGLQQVFTSLGASAIVDGGQTHNPSTQELLGALTGLKAQNVIILPNNSNVIMAAEQTKQFADKNVRVVHTKTVPQGISALLSFNYQADLDDNVELMEDARQQIQTAEVTRAVRAAQVNGLSVDEGQIIGLLNGDLVAAGDSLEEVIDDLLDRMQASDYDIITVYYGEGIEAEEAQLVADHIQEMYPDPEVEVVDGGQPHYQYIVSAE